jgi:hypothetical protein
MYNSKCANYMYDPVAGTGRHGIGTEFNEVWLIPRITD